MENLSELLKQLPEESKDLRVNAKRVIEDASTGPERAWAVALTSAYFLRDDALIKAVKADAASVASAEALEDARASASIMGMNGIYYRFRHLMDSDVYNKKPANLRMMRMSRPATSKVDFELNSFACAVLAGCAMCLKAHEQQLMKEGVTDEQIHDAARIASVLHGVSVALAASDEA